MKHLISILLLFCMTPVNAQTILKGDMNGDGQITIADVTLLVNVILGKAPTETIDDENEHEYVDLGLPSGTLWATCNIGANSPEELGDYFAWGETEGYNDGKTNFNCSTYKWSYGSTSAPIKYCDERDEGYNGIIDGKKELELEDDAAYVKWGSKWRMPSRTQIRELININYTTTEWITYNGVNGYKITSRTNGRFIFFPAGGRRIYDSLHSLGSFGAYWSLTLDSYTIDGSGLFFNEDIYIREEGNNRWHGNNIRPVRFAQ